MFYSDAPLEGYGEVGRGGEGAGRGGGASSGGVNAVCTGEASGGARQKLTRRNVSRFRVPLRCRRLPHFMWTGCAAPRRQSLTEGASRGSADALAYRARREKMEKKMK